MPCRLASAVLFALAAPVHAARLQMHLVRDEAAAAGMQSSSKSQVLKWCTLREGTFGCDEGLVIRVGTAFYNRFKSSDCTPAGGDRSIVCEPNATHQVAAACGGRQRCTLRPEEHQPCPGNPYTFLRVTYHCVGGGGRMGGGGRIMRKVAMTPKLAVVPSTTPEPPKVCKAGFWGPLCEKACDEGCAGGCSREEGACDEGCVPGMWSDFCDMPCPEGTGPAGCEQQSGMPLECEEGRRPGVDPKDNSPACLKACPKNCLDGVCGEDGACSAGCKPGFHGAECQLRCPSGCQGPCDASTTGLADGECSLCQPGLTGERCDERCHASCQTCGQRGEDARGPTGCTSCAADEPEALFGDGSCGCLEGAARSGEDGRCRCKESDFVAEPEKECRARGHGCLEGFVPVPNSSKKCWYKLTYYAVKSSGPHGFQGKCKEGYRSIRVIAQKPPECIHEDDVRRIKEEWEPEG
mmetsp:Transcript_3471/g.10436  ORF Transcript_3471/g.10436 Transcript_3471/m.10436 type:complete len:465 (+) Transcript_3471:109-1503(+)